MFKVIITRGNQEEIYADKISNESQAEKKFLKAVEATISNFDEYTNCDINTILEQRYENYGSGRIEIVEY